MVAFLWSAVLMGMAVVPASAQVPTSTGVVTTKGGTTQSIAVVPFENVSGYHPETFGQESSDAVATELRDRLNLDVLPKADVELWLRDLGYKPPFSDVELARLATELEVPSVVTGQVRSARIVENRGERYVEITLAILLFDRNAQAATNGALVTSRSPSSPEASPDTLYAKALQQAAFDVVQRMRTRPTVTAMVLWARDTTVFLNVGGRAGVEPGMKMVAMRDNLRIGMVEVTEASPIGSYATIVQGPPLRTGDHLRGVYELPIGAARLTPQRAERKRKGMQNMVLAALAILGAAEIGAGSRQMEEGNVAAPGFQASNVSNGVLAEYSDPSTGSPSILLTWVPFTGTEKTRLAGYEVWRNQELVFVLGPMDIAAQNYFVDFDFTAEFESTVTIDDSAEAVPTFDFTRVSSTSTTLGITVTDYEFDYIFLHTGAISGEQLLYQIKPIVAVQVPIAGTTVGSATTLEWRLSRTAELSSPGALVTAVAPPTQATAAVTSNVATFTFYTPLGADQAEVQIARDPNDTFPPDKTFSKVLNGIVPGKNSIAVDLKKEFQAALPGTASTLLFWRVGIRNRNDPTPPRPVPLTLGNDAGFVWNGAATKLSGVSTAVDLGQAAKRQQRDMSRMGNLGRGSHQHGAPGQTDDRVFRTN
jgi:TolB-like protein